jgi:hypothetical protein
MGHDPEITIVGPAKNLIVTDRAIKKQIGKLKAGGRIRRIDSDKGSHCQSVDRRYPASSLQQETRCHHWTHGQHDSECVFSQGRQHYGRSSDH